VGAICGWNARGGLKVTVANGERVPCLGVFRNTAFAINGEPFAADLFVLPLAGYDIVLGTQWLAALGPILWDFGTLTMSFWRRDHQVVWRGVAGAPVPSLQAYSTENIMEALLAEFEPVFADPQGLPPARSCNHKITLTPGAQPVAVRPYRYPVAHKDELERQCATMLAQGLIRRSLSAFSSPVLLVMKPDDSWRFCADYRALNAITVKDAFPIPVVTELIDELRGAKFFTKLDLRSGYHQARMVPADVHKTAFHTHEGLFEFLVMPFGFCNVPATFQALMNEVLQPFLRRFVLVFFDDILIFSDTWADHLRIVLSTLQRHQLFVKRSKCAFGVSSIQYLGHIISADGVAMDPPKVQVVREWPQPGGMRIPRARRVLPPVRA